MCMRDLQPERGDRWSVLILILTLRLRLRLVEGRELLLQDLARHVERQVVAVDDALEEGEPPRQQLLLEALRDEDALDEKLDRGHLEMLW
jgi:hypothetical protein